MATQGERRRSRAEKNQRLWEERQAAPKPVSMSVIDAIDREILRPTVWARKPGREALDVLFADGLITLKQHSSGWRLHSDWRRSGGVRSVVSSYNGWSSPSASDDKSDMAEAAAWNVRTVMASVPPAAQGLVMDLCFNVCSITDVRSTREASVCLQYVVDGYDKI